MIKIKYAFLYRVLALFFLYSARALSMELAIGEATINQLSVELLPTIFFQKDHKYPWGNLGQAQRLASVCKQWHAVVFDVDTVIQAFNMLPMHYAALKDDVSKIIELKFAGHSPFAPDEQKYTPLDYAIVGRCFQAANLLRMGLDLPHSRSLLYMGEKERGFLQLFEQNQSVSYTPEELLCAIQKNDYDTTANIVLKDIAILKDVHQVCIEQARLLGSDRIERFLRYIMQSIIEVIFFKSIYAERSLGPFFQIFKEYQANPNVYDPEGETLLHCVVKKEKLGEMFQQLLQLEGINVNQTNLIDNLNPLQVAVKMGRIDYLAPLIAKGADVNCITPEEQTLLHVAVDSKKIECLAFLVPLLRHHINSRDKHGYSPLIYAFTKQNRPCIDLLLQENADVTIKDNYGQQALHFAASRNSADLIPLLIQKGADINALSHANSVIGGTHCGLFAPLHYAALYDRIPAITELIKHGADMSLKTQTGKTALELLVTTLMKKEAELAEMNDRFR